MFSRLIQHRFPFYYHNSFYLSYQYYCNSSNKSKKDSVIKKFSSGNWTKERQDAVTETLLQTKDKLQEKWKKQEELIGGDEETMEKVKINDKTGEIGGPKGPEPTRFGDWERKGRVSDF